MGELGEEMLKLYGSVEGIKNEIERCEKEIAAVKHDKPSDLFIVDGLSCSIGILKAALNDIESK